MRSQEHTSQSDLKVLCHDSSPVSLKSLLFRDLKLDVNQPWERSLMHSLRYIRSDSAPTKKHVDKVLLQHTDSRDQAVDMDFADDETILTCPLGVTTHSVIYRQTPREASLIDLTFSSASSFKILRGTFINNTWSSVTSPGEEDLEEVDQQECRSKDTDDEQRDAGSSMQPRRASVCSGCSSRTSHRSRHIRQLSAPILRAGAIMEEYVQPPRENWSLISDDEDNAMYSSSIVESERSVSSAGFMGYAYWGSCPFKGLLINQAMMEHCTGMTDDLVHL